MLNKKFRVFMASAMAAAIVCGCGAKPADAPVEEPAVESEAAEDAAETAEEVKEDAAEEGIKAEGVSDLKKPAEDASAEEKLEYALAEISNAESMDMGIHMLFDGKLGLTDEELELVSGLIEDGNTGYRMEVSGSMQTSKAIGVLDLNIDSNAFGTAYSDNSKLYLDYVADRAYQYDDALGWQYDSINSVGGVSFDAENPVAQFGDNLDVYSNIAYAADAEGDDIQISAKIAASDMGGIGASLTEEMVGEAEDVQMDVLFVLDKDSLSLKSASYSVAEPVDIEGLMFNDVTVEYEIRSLNGAYDLTIPQEALYGASEYEADETEDALIEDASDEIVNGDEAEEVIENAAESEATDVVED